MKHSANFGIKPMLFQELDPCPILQPSANTLTLTRVVLRGAEMDTSPTEALCSLLCNTYDGSSKV